MIGRKGRQECLPPWQDCLQSYICKPANYQPPALIELLFDNLIARQGYDGFRVAGGQGFKL